MEPGVERVGGEGRPAVDALADALVHDGAAAAEAVDGRTLVALELDQRPRARRIGRSSHDLQIATWCGEHQPGRRDIEDLDASVGDQGEQLDDVEVPDECVGDVQQGLGEPRSPLTGSLDVPAVPGGDEAGELTGRHRSGKEEALGPLDVQGPQGAELGL